MIKRTKELHSFIEHFLDGYHEQGKHFEGFENNCNFLGVLDEWENDEADRFDYGKLCVPYQCF